MAFPKQDYWSGLPFPSPMHESEVTQSCPTLSHPMDCSLPGSSVHGIFRQEYWSGVPLPSPLVLLSWMKIRLDLSLQNLNFKALRFEEVTYHIIILFHFFTFSYHCFPHNSTHLYFKEKFIYLLIFDCAGSLLRLPWWLR